MKSIRSLTWPAMLVLAVITHATRTHAAVVIPVTGWGVHNGSSTITDANTDDPKFTPADDGLGAMAGFNNIQLSAPGDYIQFTTNLQINSRSGGTGAQTLNTQLRFGIFDFSGATPKIIVPSDVTNHGIIAQYGNGLSGADHLLVREQGGAGGDPFNSLTNIGTVGNGAVTADSGGDSISGATPPLITYDMMIKRTAVGTLDITGKIQGGNYLSTFSLLGFSSATFPTNGPFNFDRVGVWFGNNVNAANAQLTDAQLITNVPELSSWIMASIVTVAGVWIVRFAKRASWCAGQL